MRDAVNEFRRVGTEFLLTDIDVALTFLDLADTSSQPETVRRNCDNARRAYDTVIQYMDRLDLTNTDREELLARLQHLEQRLRDAKDRHPTV